MVHKLEVVQSICRLVGITRRKPSASTLSKPELYAVYARLNLVEQEKALKASATPKAKRK